MLRASSSLLAVGMMLVTSVAVAVPISVKVCTDVACTVGCQWDNFTWANNPNGCDGGRQLVVGNLTFSLTKFSDGGCNQFADRRVEFGNVAQCVPWGDGSHAIVPALGNAPIAYVKYLVDCKDSQELRMAQGSCNPRPTFSLMPLCLRGRVLVQYFDDQQCTQASTAVLLQSNNCIEPLLKTDTGSLQFNCAGYNEAVCLSLRGNAWYIVLIALLPFLSAVPLASTFFAALFVSLCHKKKEPTPNSANVQQKDATDPHDVEMDKPSDPAVAPADAAPKELSRANTPTLKASMQVVVIGADMSHEVDVIKADVDRVGGHEPFVSHPTVSQYSTDTMRGMQVLTSFTGLTSGALIMQAAIQQTLTGSFCRPWWLFMLQCIGYASIAITGLAPSDNVTAGRRRQNAFLCFSCTTVHKWICGVCTTTGLTHVSSFLVYLLLPPLCMLVAFLAVESSCHDGVELGLVIAMFVCLIVHGFAGHNRARLSFLSEMLTVGLSLILYIYYETGIMWRCALA